VILGSSRLPSCIPSPPRQQLDLRVVRIDPGDQPLAIESSALGEPEADRLSKLFPTGILRSGLSASVTGSDGGPRARMLVVVTGPLPPRSSLPKPRAGSIVYVQNGSSWRRYPEDALLILDSVEMSPLVNGKIRLKYWEGAPAEFAFFVPVEARAGGHPESVKP
jgi:hypothetical protein